MREDDEVASDQPEADEVETEPDAGPDAEQNGLTDDAGASRPIGDEVESLRELVVFLVENLIDNPEDAEVVAEQRGALVQIRVRLPEAELGKLIGRGGRIAKAIRTALMVAGSRHHLRVSLDIES